MTSNIGVELDKAPPLPPGATTQLPPPESMGMGPMGGNPAMLGLQHLQTTKNGMLGLITIFPELAQILNPTIAQLEQVVTMAMADKMSGSLPGAPGTPMPTQAPPPSSAGGQGTMGM